MNDLLQAVGLSALVPVLPRLLEQAQRTQPTYAAFLQQTLEIEAAGRAERARARAGPSLRDTQPCHLRRAGYRPGGCRTT